MCGMASKPLDNMQETLLSESLKYYPLLAKQHSKDRESNIPRIQQTVAIKPINPWITRLRFYSINNLPYG
jgi:hypothetical protein